MSQVSGFGPLFSFLRARDSGPPTLFVPQERPLAVLIPVTSRSRIQTVVTSLSFPTLAPLQAPASISSYRHPPQVSIRPLPGDCGPACLAVLSPACLLCRSASPWDGAQLTILIMPPLCLRFRGGTCSLSDPSGLPVLLSAKVLMPPAVQGGPGASQAAGSLFLLPSCVRWRVAGFVGQTSWQNPPESFL